MSDVVKDAVRADLLAEASPDEASEFQELLARAQVLDKERFGITTMLNLMRQRFAQRRLARERGRPFGTMRHRIGKSAVRRAAEREG